jgi:hypothetical protein
VEVTPYDEVSTKNQMPPLRMAGNKDTINGITYTVNDNLSVDVVGTATDDSEYEIAHFTVMEDKTLVLSGCPSGAGVIGEFDGTLEIKHLDGTFESYEDVGFDIQVEFEEGDECIYKIFVAQGQTVNTTFCPMLRETTETSTYEHYGTELVAADTVMLFTGYIDNGHYDQDKGWLKLTAYDVLSKLSSFNVWNWYRTAFSNGAMNLDDLLDSFATYVDTNSGYDFELSLTRCPVILEDVKIKKQLNNKEMTATEFLKSFCQLACGMGMIDRDGKFQIIYMNAQASGSETITYYRGLTAKDFVATPFTEGITIRTNNDDNGVTVLAPEQYDPSIWNSDTYDTYVIDNDDQDITLGKYIIETNGIVKKLSVAKRRAILSIDLSNLPTAYYTFKSYELQCNGLPYLECGDRIVYQPTLQDTPIVFNVVSRKLKGIQAMVDTYSFEIDPHKKYGGSTSKKKDEVAAGNVENEESVNNMTTISVTENGTYEPYDYDAMGFSSVTVDVAGGGSWLQGFDYEGVAKDDLVSGDLVHVCLKFVKGEDYNGPVIIPSHDDIPTGAIAIQGDTAYYNKNDHLYRVNWRDLNATPELVSETPAQSFYRDQYYMDRTVYKSICTSTEIVFTDEGLVNPPYLGGVVGLQTDRYWVQRGDDPAAYTYFAEGYIVQPVFETIGGSNTIITVSSSGEIVKIVGNIYASMGWGNISGTVSGCMGNSGIGHEWLISNMGLFCRMGHFPEITGDAYTYLDGYLWSHYFYDGRNFWDLLGSSSESTYSIDIFKNYNQRNPDIDTSEGYRMLGLGYVKNDIAKDAGGIATLLFLD